MTMLYLENKIWIDNEQCPQIDKYVNKSQVLPYELMIGVYMD